MLSNVTACSIGTEPLNHTMDAAGLEPLTSHFRVTLVPSRTGEDCSWSTSTTSGATVRESKAQRYKR